MPRRAAPDGVRQRRRPAARGEERAFGELLRVVKGWRGAAIRLVRPVVCGDEPPALSAWQQNCCADKNAVYFDDL